MEKGAISVKSRWMEDKSVLSRCSWITLASSTSKNQAPDDISRARRTPGQEELFLFFALKMQLKITMIITIKTIVHFPLNRFRKKNTKPYLPQVKNKVTGDG